MSRRMASWIAIAAAILAAAPAAAAPPDLATTCAILFSSQARGLATVDGSLYPMQWYRMSLSRTAVTLDLVVTKPTGAARYSGFKCETDADGQVVTVSSPSSR
jgi:hypothetical protein